MDLTPYVTALEDSLAAAAEAGDESTRRTAAALAATLGPSARLALMNALADFAADVTDALGDRAVELRLEGGEVSAVVSTAAIGSAPEAPGEPVDLGGEPIRITLRLPEGLKDQAERAAAESGVSLNTWLTRAVQGALGAVPPGSAGARPRVQRLRGWVQG